MNSKKLFPPITPIIFPYILTLTLALVYLGFDLDFLFFIEIAPIIFVISVIEMIIKLYRCNKSDCSSDQMLQANMKIKLLQIPAYIINFITGVLAFFTIVAMGGSVIIIVYDVATICLSGVWAFFGLLKAKKENRLKNGEMVLFALSQFIFCIDVIMSIIIFIRVKNSAKQNRL